MSENSAGRVALIFVEGIPLLFRGKLQHWLKTRKLSFREEAENDANFITRNLKFWSQTVLKANETTGTGYIFEFSGFIIFLDGYSSDVAVKRTQT